MSPPRNGLASRWPGLAGQLSPRRIFQAARGVSASLCHNRSLPHTSRFATPQLPQSSSLGSAMIAHDPSLVILSITIAILGTFTASVMTSNVGALSRGEGRMRIVMAALTLGGCIWAMNFVGLLSMEVPVNLDLRSGAAWSFGGGRLYRHGDRAVSAVAEGDQRGTAAARDCPARYRDFRHQLPRHRRGCGPGH